MKVDAPEMETLKRRTEARRTRSSIAITGVILVGLATAAPAFGHVPQPTVSTATAASAWIVVRDATANVGLAPGKSSGNSSGGVNHVDRLSTGQYLITFDGVAADHGNVLVSTLGWKPKICSPATWVNGGTAEQIDVRCFTRTGIPANATFIVNWLTASGIGGKLAYAHDFSPTSNCGTPSNQYVSNGGTISTCPALSATVARYKIPGLGSSRGTVQVTAFGHRTIDDVSTFSAGMCGLVLFYPQVNPDTFATDEYVDVKCIDLDGQSQIYREHDAWFMQGLGMKGVNRTNVAYVFANRGGASSYTPDPAFSYSSAGGTNTAKRLGLGWYEVKLPGMPLGGSAQVTAYLGSPDAAPRHCVVARIETTTLPQRVQVKCFDLSGDRIDSKFTLAYAR